MHLTFLSHMPSKFRLNVPLKSIRKLRKVATLCYKGSIIIHSKYFSVSDWLKSHA